MLSSFLQTLDQRLSSFTPQAVPVQAPVQAPAQAPAQAAPAPTPIFPSRTETPSISVDELLLEMQDTEPTDSDKEEAAGLLSSLKASLG